MRRSPWWAALGVSLLALGCGGNAAMPDGGRDARDGGDVAESGGGVAGDGGGVADSGDAPEPDTAADGGDAGGVSLPTPERPQVDCAALLRLTLPDPCIVHVAPGGSTAKPDGLSWKTAFGDVQDALDAGSCGCDVWIAAGSYLPTRGPVRADPDPRASTFLVWPRVHVYGGFAGTETSTIARLPGNETILSGNLGDAATRDDNAYHVVWPGNGAVLDGVTVSAGHANGFEVGQGVGAGVFVVGANITLRNVSITDNDAGTGGGLFADGDSILFLDRGVVARNVADVGGGIGTSAQTAIDGTRFFENVGVFIGGAVASNARSVSVRNATFTRNRGDFGASVALSAGEGVVAQSWFEGNVAGLFGGALFLRLGSHARLTNSVVVANSSIGHGGAVTVWTAGLDVDSTTIVDNSAAFGGAVLVKDGATVTLKDSVLWRNSDDAGKTFFLEGENNSLTVTTCDLPAEVPSAASFDEDPLLGNVPLATRFAESKGGTDQMTLAQADQHFAVGDRIELGDDGVERHVTAVDAGSITFGPAWATATPRYLRVDRWAAGAPSLTLDLAPTAASPLVDAASAAAPPVDVLGRRRAGPADLGAIEFLPK